MPDLTPEQIAIRDRRRNQYPDFVEQSYPALVEFAQTLGLAQPEAITTQPAAFLAALSAFFQHEDFSDLAAEERNWLHAMLTYYVGQYLIQRYGTLWQLDENPDSKFFLRYVITYFKGGYNPNLKVDPASIVEEYLNQPPERDLAALIGEVEGEIEQARSAP